MHMLKALTIVSRGIINNQRNLFARVAVAGAGVSRNYGQSTQPAVAHKDQHFNMSHSPTTGQLAVLAPDVLKTPLVIPEKLLMGPGPTNQSPRVLKACSLEMGHMHPETFQAMDEIKAGMRYVFQTNNPWTLAISGPGHLAMEAILVNLLESGETVLIGSNGLWGNRCRDMANRIGANPVALEVEGGKSVPLAQIQEGLIKHKPKVLFLVHSESSTGVMQPLAGVGDLCRAHGCLLAVDAVASLGGVPFYMDEWKVDAVYTGSQKVIGAPPGLAPISFGPRAVEKIKTRNSPIKTYLLDMTQLTIQWQCNDPSIPRIYHHTTAVNLIFALREALAELTEEGLENVWKRHGEAAARLHAGLQSLGLKLFVENPADRLPTVTTIVVPEGIDWKIVTQYAMDKYKIEIAGGLGPTVGKVFRIGVLGYNATPAKIDRVLQALKEGLEFAKLQGRL